MPLFWYQWLYSNFQDNIYGKSYMVQLFCIRVLLSDEYLVFHLLVFYLLFSPNRWSKWAVQCSSSGYSFCILKDSFSTPSLLEVIFCLFVVSKKISWSIALKLCLGGSRCKSVKRNVYFLNCFSNCFVFEIHKKVIDNAWVDLRRDIFRCVLFKLDRTDQVDLVKYS